MQRAKYVDFTNPALVNYRSSLSNVSYFQVLSLNLLCEIRVKKNQIRIRWNCKSLQKYFKLLFPKIIDLLGGLYGYLFYVLLNAMYPIRIQYIILKPIVRLNEVLSDIPKINSALCYTDVKPVLRIQCPTRPSSPRLHHPVSQPDAIRTTQKHTNTLTYLASSTRTTRNCSTAAKCWA